MITLGIIIYVIISLCVYWSYRNDNYDDFLQEWEPGSSRKEGWIMSFSILPTVAILCGLFIVFAKIVLYILTGVLWLVLWILTNMP